MYRMLIVDDERWEREGLCAFLDWQQLGIEVAGCARNGTEGLRMAKDVRPQIVVTDILMPVMDGIVMSRGIRRLFPDVRIILLSGHDDFQYAKESFSFQAFDYLLKPVEKSVFKTAMRRVVASLQKEERWHQEQELLKAQSVTRSEDPAMDDREPVMDDREPVMDDHEPAMDDGKYVIETIRGLIAQQYVEHLDLGEISRKVHLTPYYIGELFRKHEGVGFTQYLTDYRLDKARQMLSNTSHQVARIAMGVGIPNRSYFCKLFKDKFGVSPGEYRNVLKGRRTGG